MIDQGPKTLAASVQIKRRFPCNIVARDIELFEEEAAYRTLGSRLLDFGGCWVTADSVAYKNGLLLKDTLAAPEQVHYYRFRHLAKRLLTGKRVRLSADRPYLLATDLWSVGHYHWLTETLPKLFLLAKSAAEFILLLPPDEYFQKIGLASMRLAGIEFADTVIMEREAIYMVPNLHYVTRIASAGQVDDALMQHLHQRFIEGGRTRNRRIYVSRERAAMRKVLNESDFTQLLKKYEFEVLHSEDMSLSDQIRVFLETDVLIGIHGAGLTNCLFMNPGGTVLELRKREKNYAYWHLADSLGHNYLYYHGVPDSDSSLIGRGSNLHIDLDDFETRVLRPLEEGQFQP